MQENDPVTIQKKKDKQTKLSEKYKARITEFVNQMADAPLTKVDDYQTQWYKKYGEKKPIRNKSFAANTHRSGLYSTSNAFNDHSSPMSTRTRGPLQLPNLNSTNYKLEPIPFRFTSRDTTERIADTMASNACLDTFPADVDKKAFYLRQRQPDKELAHSQFRTKSFSTVDKLNHMYEDDTKILDVEVIGPNAGTINANYPFKAAKKRLSMPQAVIKYKKKTEQDGKKQLILTPEFLESEKKKIMAKLARSAIPGQPEPNTEQIYDMIMQKMQKTKIEAPDLGNRNFMLPSYHTKTHFKGATALHMQVGTALKSNIADLREEFGLKGLRPQEKGNISSSMLSEEDRGRNIEPAEFTKAVLQNCGEYRMKDMKVIPTERGTGFMRKLSSIQSIDPARTFFGAGSKIATNLYGNTSKEILESTMLNTKRHIALASQKGGTQTTQFNHSIMSFGNASKSGIGMNKHTFANQNVSIQNLDLKARLAEKRSSLPRRISAAEILLLGSKDDTMTQEYEDLKQNDKEFNEEIPDDDSFFNEKIPMGNKPDYKSLMEVNIN